MAGAAQMDEELDVARRTGEAGPPLPGWPPAAGRPTLLARFQALNIRPIHLYGLSESYGPTSICA